MLTRLPITQITKELIDQAVDSYPNSEERIILNEPTGNFFYDPWKIKDEYKGTVWESLLNTLPYKHGEARVIRLEPAETYMSHADIDNRWHLNLKAQQAYLIDLTEGKLFNLKPDKCWYYMNAGELHVASNFGSYDRLQLVVRELLVNTIRTDLVSVTIKPAEEQYDYRYKFDNIISPWLNRMNKSGMLADFNFQGQEVSFKVVEEELSWFREMIITNDFEVSYA